MKFTEIIRSLEKLKVFSLNDLYLIDPQFRRATLYEWENKEKIIQIRQGWYVLNDFNPKDSEIYFIANKIYSPSYISLELALSYHNIIPETVQKITSVTTQKTKTFDSKIGLFSYQTVKSSLFWGYMIKRENNIPYRIATLEKSILDYIYLNSHIKDIDDYIGMRFNAEILKRKLNKPLMEEYLTLFNKKILNTKISNLYNFIEKSNKND